MRKILIILLTLLPTSIWAQFYVTGDDPGRLKWNYMDTESFRIIYPVGADSLAKTYGRNLEMYKIPVSRSVGFKAGDGDGKKMPAVLHTYNTSNGSVAWAPKRMDLFTIPTAYDPEPLPWHRMLSVHEGRHVAQMQFGMTKYQKPFGYVFGQMWNILVSLLYPGLYFLEGDAVTAETALTNSGRGRTADFLNYYRVAFDHGDFRNWERWNFGSQKYYAPNYYALGYMRLSTSRYIYDYPDVMKDGYQMATKKIFNISPFLWLVKKKTGKSHDESFKEVCDTMQAIWSKDAEKRAPFIPMEAVSISHKRYTEYDNINIIDNELYAIKKGFVNTPVLVKIESDGEESHLKAFSYNAPNIQYFEGKLYWSEDIPDPRWSMKSDSRIKCIDIENMKTECLTERKDILFNPFVLNGKICSVQYFPQGGTAINIDGEIYKAPDGMQLVEPAWIGEYVYASGLSDKGFGIYRLDIKTSEWSTLLAPQPVKITGFSTQGDELTFTCDLTGVNELYHLNPTTGELRQKTCTRYGGTDHCYDDNEEYLYFTSQTLNGVQIFRTATEDLIDRKVDFSDKYVYPIAECISKQEKDLALAAGDSLAVDENIKVEFSEPKRYNKFLHAFNIHSWAPVYVSVNNIMNMSFDHIYQAASLGVSGIMQNTLSTAVGEIGYSAHKDPYDKSKWRHSGHLKFTYSGWYPVFELSIDFNDRAARQYSVSNISGKNSSSYSLTSKALDKTPYIEGKLTTYIPFNFSSGGWQRGLIPQLSYNMSNDKFNTSISQHKYQENLLNPSLSNKKVFTGVSDGKNTFRHLLSASVRGYTMLSTPNSAVYPRWGIGAEIGVSGDFSAHNILSPMGYVYGYGYVPGIIRTQGLKLSAIYQHKLDKKSIFGAPVVNFLPRGLSNNAELASMLSATSPSIGKVTADYAIPIYIGDVSIGKGFLYIKRLTLTPHVDYMKANNYNLMSVGTSLTVDLNGIIWIGWPVSIGATYSYNGLLDFNKVKQNSGIKMDKNHVGFIFNVSF